MTKSNVTVNLQHRNPRIPKVKEPWGIRIDGVYQVGVNRLFPKEKKKFYSKHTSFSYADPTKEYLPPAFGKHDKDREQLLTGIMIPSAEKNALIQRITQYDRSTYERSYLYPTKRAALEAYQDRLKKKAEFTSLDDLAAAKVVNDHNEVMARAQWDDDCRLLIFSDTLAMRIFTQIRAINVANRIAQRCKENGTAYSSKKIAIGFYANTASKLKEYSNEEQEHDLKIAMTSSDPSVKRYALFHQLCTHNFVVTQQQFAGYSFDDIKQFITLASNLTFETSVLFYKNFLSPHAGAIIKQLRDHSELTLLVDIFMCVPPAERQELIVKKLSNPQHRAYYLFTLMQRENFESDDKELMALLSDPSWEFDSTVTYNGKSLLDAAMEYNLFFAVKPLLAKKCQQQGGEPLQEYPVIHERIYGKLQSAISSDSVEVIIAALRYDPAFLFKNEGLLHLALDNVAHIGTIKLILSCAEHHADELTKCKNKNGKDFFTKIAEVISTKLSELNFDRVEHLLEYGDSIVKNFQWEGATAYDKQNMRLVTLLTILRKHEGADFIGYLGALQKVRLQLANEEIYDRVLEVFKLLKAHESVISPQLLIITLKACLEEKNMIFNVILRAIQTNEVTLVKRLLAANLHLLYELDKKGMNLLEYAICWGESEIIDFIRKHDVAF